jgi:tetratricopeptide (TPR) repeat protein
MVFYSKVVDLFIKTERKNYELLSLLYAGFASIQIEDGDFDEALKWLKNAQTLLEIECGVTHLNTAVIYNQIGNLYASQGQHEEALSWSLKALPAFDTIPDEAKDSNAAVFYVKLGKTYAELNQKDEALHYGLKALSIFERIFGTDHEETATACFHLADTFDYFEQYEEALEWYQKALIFFGKEENKSSEKAVQLYSPIAQIYIKKAEQTGNANFYYQALEFYEKGLETETKYVRTGATQYYNLAADYLRRMADIYEKLGDGDKAIECNAKVNMEIEEFNNFLEQKGEEQRKEINRAIVETGTVHLNAGIKLKEEGNYEEAIKALWQALEGFEIIPPETSDYVMNVYFQFIDVYARQEDYEKLSKWLYNASMLCEEWLDDKENNDGQALVWQEKVFDKIVEFQKIENIYIADSCYHFASGYFKRQDYATALMLLNKSLELNTKFFGPDAPDTQTVINDIALVITIMLESIETKISEGEALLEVGELPDESELAMAYVMHGDYLVMLGYYAEAIPNFDKAIEMLVPMWSEDQITLAVAKSLAKAYSDRGVANHALGEAEAAVPDLRASIYLWEKIKEAGKPIDEDILKQAYIMLQQASFLADPDNDLPPLLT